MDRPEILAVVFHPRPDTVSASEGGGQDLLIPLESGVTFMARVHQGPAQGANLLFFHGNGEIVPDYDHLGPIYTQMGMTFIPVDYRGYGQSTGSPSISGLLRDSHTVFDEVRSWLEQRGHTGPLIVMGRSLGSAAALELAANPQQECQGLIVESGFALTMPLLTLLGLDVQSMGLDESKGMGNLEKMVQVHLPCLIIHAELDHIIPISDARALYEACPFQEKTFVRIPGANHNDIFIRDLNAYMQAVRNLADVVSKG